MSEWTEQTPTEEGWYWMQANDYRPRVRLLEFGGDSRGRRLKLHGLDSGCGPAYADEQKAFFGKVRWCRIHPPDGE